MKRFLTSRDVLSDIEFELLQSSISRDELARSIRTVKVHQAKLREEFFAPDGHRSLEELAARQFQVNDMLLTLLQEMAARQREISSELRQLGELAFAGLPEEEASRGSRLLLDMWSTSELESFVDQWPPQEIQDAMDSDVLMPEMVLQPPRTPVVGGLINRLRIALHRVAIFYVERLAQRQSKINAVYGSWLEKLVRNAHEQREMLRVLSGQVDQLESGSVGGSTPCDA